MHGYLGVSIFKMMAYSVIMHVKEKLVNSSRKKHVHGLKLPSPTNTGEGLGTAHMGQGPFGGKEAWQGAPGPWLDLAHSGAYERSEQLLLVVLVPPHKQGGGRNSGGGRRRLADGEARRRTWGADPGKILATRPFPAAVVEIRRRRARTPWRLLRGRERP